MRGKLAGIIPAAIGYAKDVHRIFGGLVMGVIRKTASIGTLGMINFRSKKEKLRRAERITRDALSERDAEHLAREVAESGFAQVKTELRRLSSAEEKAAKQLARLRRRSRKVRKADRLSAMLNTAEPVVRDGMKAARTTMHEVAVEGRKRGRRRAQGSQERLAPSAAIRREGVRRRAVRAPELVACRLARCDGHLHAVGVEAQQILDLGCARDRGLVAPGDAVVGLAVQLEGDV